MPVLNSPPADVFIETGISVCDTLRAVMEYDPPYESIHTIDLEAGAVGRGRIVSHGHANVTVHQGSSPDVLPQIMDGSKKTVFWLDAHWSPNEGQTDRGYLDDYGECPLLGELAAIKSVDWQTAPIIYIDDAPIFRRDGLKDQAYRGIDANQWPTEDQIKAALPDGFVLLDGPGGRYYEARKGA